MANTQDVDMASEHPGPSRSDAGEETDVDVEIVEEGEEGETAGPVPVAVKDQSDLEPATYRINHSTQFVSRYWPRGGAPTGALSGSCIS